jgi:hypothetical protein
MPHSKESEQSLNDDPSPLPDQLVPKIETKKGINTPLSYVYKRFIAPALLIPFLASTISSCSPYPQPASIQLQATSVAVETPQLGEIVPSPQLPTVTNTALPATLIPAPTLTAAPPTSEPMQLVTPEITVAPENTRTLSEIYDTNVEYLDKEGLKAFEEKKAAWIEYFSKGPVSIEKYKQADKNAKEQKQIFDTYLNSPVPDGDVSSTLAYTRLAQHYEQFFSWAKEEIRKEAYKKTTEALDKELRKQYKFAIKDDGEKIEPVDMRDLTSNWLQRAKTINDQLLSYGFAANEANDLVNTLVTKIETEDLEAEARISQELIDKQSKGELPLPPQNIHISYVYPSGNGKSSSVGGSGILMRNEAGKIVIQTIEHVNELLLKYGSTEFYIHLGREENSEKILIKPTTIETTVDYQKDYIDELQKINIDPESQAILEKYLLEGRVRLYETKKVLPEVNDVVIFSNYDGTPGYGLVMGIQSNSGSIYLKVPIGQACNGASGGAASLINKPDQIIGFAASIRKEIYIENGRKCSKVVVFKGIGYDFQDMAQN